MLLFVYAQKLKAMRARGGPGNRMLSPDVQGDLIQHVKMNESVNCLFIIYCVSVLMIACYRNMSFSSICEISVTALLEIMFRVFFLAAGCNLEEVLAADSDSTDKPSLKGESPHSPIPETTEEAGHLYPDNPYVLKFLPPELGTVYPSESEISDNDHELTEAAVLTQPSMSTSTGQHLLFPPPVHPDPVDSWSSGPVLPPLPVPHSIMREDKSSLG